MKETKKTKKVQHIVAPAKEFLIEYMNNMAPVGFESSGQKIWLKYIKQFTHSQFTDAYGTAVAVINPEAKFKVVLEAHADEISWFVNYISNDGLIYVKRNGGSDHQIAPSMRVNIQGKKGIIKGVFGWPAIHTRTDETKENKPKVDNLWIDVGARKKKEVLDLGIFIGSVVTFADGFAELNYNHFICRAFDNKIGGFMIAEVAKLIAENKNKLPFGLYIVNAVQEEIGLRGAEMIARRIKPNIAICTDVTHDSNTPMINKNIEGDIMCGKGPSLAYAPAIHNKLLDFVDKIAQTNKINVQYRTLSRSTGTDTDSFAYANEGCPSMLISLPLRYMHTTVEMIHEQDIIDTIQLMYKTILALRPDTNLSYF
ncbi:MAG: M20/M25/M40 family metallo-hydrolase [Alphaproteobacteria bacterium]|nr:M20/M25/M40 family metallo-hydrolase [Alphaproteobacteria bacterium]